MMDSHLVTAGQIIAGIRQRGGFLTEGDLAVLAKHPEGRMLPILIRCGGGRFTAPAQDVEHFMGIILREDSDYVRDLSLVADYGGYPR